MLETIFLGLLQGLTEFLPVSSSGHLVLAQSLMESFPEGDMLLDVLLHGGTLVAVLVYFRKDILSLLRSLAPGGDPVMRKVAVFIIIATIPTGFMGLFFKELFTELFSAPRVAAVMLLVTGAILWVAEALAKGEIPMEGIGWRRSVVFGFAQGLAITPGISRSGATISAGLLMGVKGEEAARFSFLMSIPAIIGAVVLEVGDAGAATATPLAYGAGVTAAFISGLFAIRFLMAVIKKGRFRYFSIYCWSIGAAYLIFGP